MVKKNRLNLKRNQKSNIFVNEKEDALTPSLLRLGSIGLKLVAGLMRPFPKNPTL